MTEADANAVLEPGETLRHFQHGVLPDFLWAMFRPFVLTNVWKGAFAVTDRRLLVFRNGRLHWEFGSVAEVYTDTSNQLRIHDDTGKSLWLTPSDRDSLERAILELSTPARSTLLATPDNLGLESILLDNEQVLWSGKVKAQYVLGTQLRYLLWLIAFGQFLKEGFASGFDLFRSFIMLLGLLPQLLIFPNEGAYVVTNRRFLWVCGARRHSIPLAKAPEVWLRKSGVGTMLFPGKQRRQGIPDAEKAAEAIRQALAAAPPNLGTGGQVEEPGTWWLSARR